MKVQDLGLRVQTAGTLDAGMLPHNTIQHLASRKGRASGWRAVVQEFSFDNIIQKMQCRFRVEVPHARRKSLGIRFGGRLGVLQGLVTELRSGE